MFLVRRAALLAPLLSGAALPATSAHAAGWGSGHATTETRRAAEFQAVTLQGSVDLRVRQGSEPSLQVQADENLLPLLETVVEATRQGPTLIVRWKKDQNIISASRVLVTMVVPRLTALTATGSGDIRVEAFTTPALQLSLSGSSTAQLQRLSTEELGVQVSGSGVVGGSGQAKRLKAGVAGSGKLRLADVVADEASVRVAGSAEADVNAQKSLDVNVAGSGAVTYSGQATVKSSVSGSGTVTKR